MRKGIAAVLLVLLLFNISYSFFKEGEFRPPGINPSTPIVNSAEGERERFNLTPPRISEFYRFKTTFYSSLNSAKIGVNLTYTSRSEGTLRVVGYATREDSRMIKTPSLVIEENYNGRRVAHLSTPGGVAESSGDFQTAIKRYVRLQDLEIFRVEEHQNFIGEGGRSVEEEYVVFPSSSTPQTLWSELLTRLPSVEEGRTYWANLTVDLYPLPLPPLMFRFALTVERIDEEIAQLSLFGEGAGVKVSGRATVEKGYHFPISLNLTAQGRINGYSLLINFRKERIYGVKGSGEVLMVPPFGSNMEIELLPGGLLPSSGSNFNRSLYGATPEEIEEAVKDFFSEKGLEVLRVKGVQITLNTSARPSWNLTVDTPVGQYFAEIDPETLTVTEWGEDPSIYLGKTTPPGRRLTLSSQYRIMKKAAPEGFFTLSGEPNPTLKIYLYQAPPLSIITPPIP
ncbi:MAG: hypothetical protein J7L88_02970, partial [Thermoplasmata archaeon]|nr:hypothetical protein [Thermoplasmata archaeon]